MHALIIEDYGLFSIVIEEELLELGYTSFQQVWSEAAALEAAERCRPDLITADERLAPGSGAAAVRSICSGRAIPVVHIVADEQAVLSQIPDALVLRKPFTTDEFKAAVIQAQRRPFSSLGQLGRQGDHNTALC